MSSNSKLRLALFFGGQSPEHEVSIRSARNIAAAVRPDRYELLLVGVDKSGRWFEVEPQAFFADALHIEQGHQLALIPGHAQASVVRMSDRSPLHIDVVFPIIHGPNGEDGSLQGVLRQLGLPFVGPDVTASAAAMDKDLCKRILREAGQLVAEGFTFGKHEAAAIDYAGVVNKLGSPVFIKPANMGSSVGVSRADNAEEFAAAVAEAFRYDKKILVEEMIQGRELECAVMGNAIPQASGVGEVVKNEKFYDYESKYLSDTAAEVVIPAKGIDAKTQEKLRYVALQAYRALGCEGMTRVDMFLTADDRVYVNELNTLPGFTSISMYPKLWQAAGMSYAQLIDKLVDLAQEKAAEEAALEKVL